VQKSSVFPNTVTPVETGAGSRICGKFEFRLLRGDGSPECLRRVAEFSLHDFCKVKRDLTHPSPWGMRIGKLQNKFLVFFDE